MNQNDWIARAQAGDRTAVAHLFEQTIGPVYYLCCKLTASEAQAGELTRRTFMRAFSRLADIRPGVRFERWTTALAVNLCKESLRRSKPELFTTDEAEMTALNDVYVADESCIPAACMTQPELRTQAVAAVDALPPEQRLSVYLHYFAHLQPSQVSKVLCVDELTIQGRLNSARYTLRTQLTQLSSDALMPILDKLLEQDAQAAVVPEMLRSSCLQTAIHSTQPQQEPQVPFQPEPQDEPEEDEEAAAASPLNRNQKILIGVAAGLLAVIVLLFALLLKGCGKQEPAPEVEEAPVEEVDTSLESAALLEEYGIEVLLTCNERESEHLIEDWQEILPDYLLSGNPEDLQLQTEISGGQVSLVQLSLAQTDLDITRLDGLELGQKPLVSATADALRTGYELVCCGGLPFDPVTKADGSLAAYGENYRYEFIDDNADGMYELLRITRLGVGWQNGHYAPYGESLSDLLGSTPDTVADVFGEGDYTAEDLALYTMTVNGFAPAGGEVEIAAVAQSRSELDAARENVNIITIHTESGDISHLLPELKLPAGPLSLDQISRSLQSLSGHLGLLEGDVFNSLVMEGGQNWLCYYVGNTRYWFCADSNSGTVSAVEVLDLRDCKLWSTSGLRFDTGNFDLQKLLGLDRHEAYSTYGIRSYNAHDNSRSILGLWESDGIIRTVYSAGDVRTLWGIRTGDKLEDIQNLVEEADGYCYEITDTTECYVVSEKLTLQVEYADGLAKSIQLMDHSHKADYEPPEPLMTDPVEIFAEFIGTQEDVQTAFLADLNHDGEPELLVGRQSGDNCLVQLYTMADREVQTTPVYSITLEKASGGGTNLYLFTDDEGIWLMVHTQISNPGSGFRSYRVFSINGAGAEVVVEQKEAKINLVSQVLGDTEEYDQIQVEIDGHMPDSVFVCGTMDGAPSFSDQMVTAD